MNQNHECVYDADGAACNICHKTVSEQLMESQGYLKKSELTFSKMFDVTPSPLIYLDGIARTPEKRLDFFNKVKANYCVVINVADTPCATAEFQAEGIPSYWFPIVEFAEWGYTPFFSTLRVAQMYYEKTKPILIHCHAGAHRSPIVAYAILRALGQDAQQAENELEYPGLTEIFKRDINKKRIPVDIIEFLKKALANPMISLKDIGQLMGKTEGFYRDADDSVKTSYDIHKFVEMGPGL